MQIQPNFSWFLVETILYKFISANYVIVKCLAWKIMVRYPSVKQEGVGHRKNKLDEMTSFCTTWRIHSLYLLLDQLTPILETWPTDGWRIDVVSYDVIGPIWNTVIWLIALALEFENAGARWVLTAALASFDWNHLWRLDVIFVFVKNLYFGRNGLCQEVTLYFSPSSIFPAQEV